MPQFNPSQSKTARVPVTVQPSGLSCEVELFLGPNDASKVVTSGLKPFVSTGSQQQVTLPIAMPSITGSYHVYIDLYVGGSYFAGYTGTEDVVIAAPAAPPFTMSITSIVLGPTGSGTWQGYDITCLISNPNSVPVSHNLYLKYIWAANITDPNDPAAYTSEFAGNAGTRWWLTGPEVYKAVSLGSGQSVNIVSLKSAGVDIWGGVLYENYPHQITHLGEPYKWYFILVDELGNHSAPVSVGSYAG